MRKSRLSWYKQNRLIEYFMAGASARVAASLVGVNTSTASYYFHRLRVIISKKIDDNFTVNRNIILTESDLTGQFGFFYNNNQPLFFICCNEGKIVTLFFSKVSRSIASTHRLPSFEGGLVCTKDQRKSDVLDLSLCKLIKIDSCGAAINNNIGDIESFWSFSKQHLQKLNGVYKKNIIFYMAECEWRFNSTSLIKQLADLKSWVKSELC